MKKSKENHESVAFYDMYRLLELIETGGICSFTIDPHGFAELIALGLLRRIEAVQITDAGRKVLRNRDAKPRPVSR